MISSRGCSYSQRLENNSRTQKNTPLWSPTSLNAALVKFKPLTVFFKTYKYRLQLLLKGPISWWFANTLERGVCDKVGDDVLRTCSIQRTTHGSIKQCSSPKTPNTLSVFERLELSVIKRGHSQTTTRLTIRTNLKDVHYSRTRCKQSIITKEEDITRSPRP